MDYNTLLELTADLGYRLASNGAETFRVEESISRILSAYGIASESFAIPNCLIVSIETVDGKPMTRMRRIQSINNNLNAVELYNSLSRRICAEKPDPQVAVQWLHELDKANVNYTFPIYILGTFLGGLGFSIFFGATVADSICGGICGILIGLMTILMNRMRVNGFFTTIACSFIMAAAAYAMGAIGVARNTDAVVIGALMLLVPGLLFTNAMRDIIFGDTNSGVNRIVQVLLVAAAIALGTGVAWNLSALLWNVPVSTTPITYNPLIQCLAACLGCAGFCFTFNIHGNGTLLCVLGGGLAWLAYCTVLHFGGNDLLAYFIAAVISAAYSEAMARIRKCPAIAYLVISLFPMIPGAGIYYATSYLVQGDMSRFAAKGTHTIAIAGVLAVGVLTVSTLVRLHSSWLQNRADRIR